MNETLFIGFLLASLLIVATPGPSVALASAQALRSGPRAVFYCVFGDALGSLTHILIVTIGLQFLIQLSATVLPWLHMLGGGYILYLAYGSFVAPEHQTSDQEVEVKNGRAAVISGFIACVTNPKAIIFFLALFPSFIDPNINVAFQTFTYGTIFIILDACFIMSYAFMALYFFNLSLMKKLNFNIVSGVGLAIVGLILIVKGALEANHNLPL